VSEFYLAALSDEAAALHQKQIRYETGKRNYYPNLKNGTRFWCD